MNVHKRLTHKDSIFSTIPLLSSTESVFIETLSTNLSKSLFHISIFTAIVLLAKKNIQKRSINDIKIFLKFIIFVIKNIFLVYIIKYFLKKTKFSQKKICLL